MKIRNNLKTEDVLRFIEGLRSEYNPKPFAIVVNNMFLDNLPTEVWDTFKRTGRHTFGLIIDGKKLNFAPSQPLSKRVMKRIKQINKRRV